MIDYFAATMCFIILKKLNKFGFYSTCYLIMIHNEGTLRKIFFTVLKFKKNNIHHEIERSGCFYFTFFSAYQFTHFCWVPNELFERLLNYFCENEYLKHVIDDKVYMKIKMLTFFKFGVEYLFTSFIAVSRENRNNLVPTTLDIAKQILYSTSRDINKHLNYTTFFQLFLKLKNAKKHS